MKLPPHRRDRYLRDPLPIRLGGIAANLARVVSCAEMTEAQPLVASLLYESKFFIEWAAPSTPLELSMRLAELQLLIVGWERRLTQTLLDLPTREKFRETVRQWSNRLMEMSGLLEETSPSA
jgi:hypothetical protein